MNCPREGGQKGVGGKSWGEETAARKRKREVEWEGYEERGEERAQRCPHWAGGWKAQLWCLYQLPPAHTIPVPSHVVPSPALLSGWATPSAPRSLLLPRQLLFLSSSSFLPLIGQKMGMGSSCLAQQPPSSWRLGLPRVAVKSPGS